MPPKAPKDLQRELDRIHAKAEAFVNVWRLAEDKRTSCSGSDPTGAVTFNLAPDGTPMLIELAQGWRSRLRGESLGAAVITACRSAHQAEVAMLLAAVGALPLSLSDLATAKAGVGHDHRLTRAADAAAKPVSIAEAVAALKAATSPPTVSLDGVAAAGPDATSERPVAFGVGPGGVVDSCVIDPRWERFYPADQVAARLNEALHRDLAQGR